jgi:hypothetical protein
VNVDVDVDLYLDVDVYVVVDLVVVAVVCLHVRRIEQAHDYDSDDV